MNMLTRETIFLDLLLKQGNISLMRKLTLLFLVIILLPTFAMAKTAEDDRRIEEEKRKSLSPTEIEIPQEKQPSPRQSADIDLDYFRELLLKKTAINSDACQVIVRLMGVEDYVPDSSSQFALLKERNIIPEKLATGFDLSQPLRKGLTAYMFCQALEVKGGVWIRLFGMSQRYALKELIFEEIMSPGSVNDHMSGKELILTLTRAIEYITQNQ